MANKLVNKKLEKQSFNSIIAKPIFLNVILIFFQFGIFFAAWLYFANYWHIVMILNYLLSFLLIISVINQDANSGYKITWLVPLAAFPVIGAGLFIVLNLIPRAKQMSKKLLDEEIKAIEFMQKDMENSKKNIINFSKINKDLSNLAYYLHQRVNFPLYKNTTVDYYNSGEELFRSMKDDMKKAEKYIFMEFFIVSEGRLIDEMLEILKEKISQNVKVYFIYDGTNEFTLSDNFSEKIKNLGINLKIFAEIKPVISTYQNNRDHRKILVIDGKIGYTGGINLADEYVNYIDRFGHWKDTGIRLEGDSVNSLTAMFLTMWNLISNKNDRLSYEKFLTTIYKSNRKLTDFVIPFADSPTDDEKVSEDVILHMLYHAKEEILITTPYLIIDTELTQAITYAAKRGVKVKIIIPKIPDKEIPYIVAKSYLPSLIKSNVEIYKYTKGFIHSKMYIVDGKLSMTGTINLDYRSLYLHFENGVLIYDENFGKKMREDILETIEISEKATEKDFTEMFFFKRFLSRLFRVFGPLM